MALRLGSTFLQVFWAAAVQFDAYFEEAAVKNNASWAKDESAIRQKLQQLESSPAQNDGHSYRVWSIPATAKIPKTKTEDLFFSSPASTLRLL